MSQLNSEAFRALQSAAMLYPDLRDAQHFVVPKEIDSFATEIASASLEETGSNELRMSTSAMLPTPWMTLFVENYGLLELKERADGFISVALFGANAENYAILGAYLPGGPVKRFKHCFLSNEETKLALGTVVSAAFILAVINEPRVVTKTPAGCRQQRRGMQRGFGFAVNAVTRVSWDLSKPTKAKQSRDPDFHCVPLHFRRGHFRRAEQHYIGAMRRPDAIRPEDRQGWWQWIEATLVGHPSFGTRRSVHAPYMSSGKLASRFLQKRAAPKLAAA